MYKVTHVVCRRSPVTCHLSLMPKATATDPPPANSPAMHRRMVGKDQKMFNKNINKKDKEKNMLNSKCLDQGLRKQQKVISPPLTKVTKFVCGFWNFFGAIKIWSLKINTRWIIKKIGEQWAMKWGINFSNFFLSNFSSEISLKFVPFSAAQNNKKNKFWEK